MRRKKGTLVDLEWAILETVRHMAGRNESAHGFAIAAQLRERTQAENLIGHGTLYKALARLEGWKILSSEWEDADTALGEKRPRRRIYRLTSSAVAALAGDRRDVVVVNEMQQAVT